MNRYLEEFLNAENPGQLLRKQHHSGLLKHWLPEVDALYGVPQREEFHPEIDTGWHMELVMDQCARMKASPTVRLAALLHDLGKGITPEGILPRHTDHDKAGVPLVKAVCERLDVGTYATELAVTVCEQHIRLYQVPVMQPSTIVSTYYDVFAGKEYSFAIDFVMACQCDSFGRLGKEKKMIFNEGLLMLGCIRALENFERKMSKHGTDLTVENQHRERIRIVRYLKEEHIANQLDL